MEQSKQAPGVEEWVSLTKAGTIVPRNCVACCRRRVTVGLEGLPREPIGEGSVREKGCVCVCECECESVSVRVCEWTRSASRQPGRQTDRRYEWRTQRGGGRSDEHAYSGSSRMIKEEALLGRARVW